MIPCRWFLFGIALLFGSIGCGTQEAHTSAPANSTQPVDDYSATISNTSELIKDAPDSGQLYFIRGSYYSLQSHTDSAIRDFDSAIALGFADSMVFYARAATFSNNALWHGDTHCALRAGADFRRVISMDSSFALAWYGLGTVTKFLGDTKTAIAHYTTSLGLARDSLCKELAFYNRANAYRALRRNDLAIADYSAALEIAPEKIEAFWNRGNAHYDIGRSREAVRDFTAVIALDSANAGAYLNRGHAFIALGDSNSASRDFSEYHRLSGSGEDSAQ